MIEKLLRISAGSAFLFLGFIGLFLPILQGILFIFIGLLILAPVSSRIRKLLDKAKSKHPVIFAKSHEIKEKLAGKFHKKTQK